MGLWPANSVNDDDIALYTDESPAGCDDLVTGCVSKREAFRRWLERRVGASRSSRPGGRQRLSRMFAVTAGIAEKKEKYFIDDLTILASVKAMADVWPRRLPRHCKAGAPDWGDTRAGVMAAAELIARRRASAARDPLARHSVSKPCEVLQAAGEGCVAESMAMMPAAASAILPEPSRRVYFQVGRIARTSCGTRRRGAGEVAQLSGWRRISERRSPAAPCAGEKHATRRTLLASSSHSPPRSRLGVYKAQEQGGPRAPMPRAGRARREPRHVAAHTERWPSIDEVIMPFRGLRTTPSNRPGMPGAGKQRTQRGE